MEKAANALIFNTNNEILLVKRADVPVWVLPGGGVDHGESPLNAAQREVLEESGINASCLEHFATYHPPYPRLLATTYVYLSRTFHGSLKTSSETIDCRFFSINNLPKPIFHAHKAIILESQKKHSLPINRQMHELRFYRLLIEIFSHPLISTKYICIYFYRKFLKKII